MEGTNRNLIIVSVSNFINHHQVHLSDAFFSHDNIVYYFVEHMPMPDWIQKDGYPDYSDRPYLVRTYLGEEERSKALDLIDNADVVIYGDAPEEWIQNRLRQNKLTFRNNERWFKTGAWHLLSPRAVYYYLKNHTRYRNKDIYMLCNGAFVARDCHKTLSYPNKCFKWGYFVNVPFIDIDDVLFKKSISQKIKLLFVARFLKLKHPELVVKLAYELKNKGIDFEINMFGNGPEMGHIKQLIGDLKLEEYVNLKGNVSNHEIIKIMQTHHILLFTSDKNEGWGAVTGEAMSSGCVVVAGNKIGSVPFLIEAGKNGMIFKDKNLKDLTQKVLYITQNRDIREAMAREAYKTMSEIWNPDNAVKSFLSLVGSIIKGDIHPQLNGPCSIA